MSQVYMQTFSLPEKQCQFSIGICASDRADNLPELIALIQRESFPEQFVLARVIIVASGCSRKAMDFTRKIACTDNRFVLIEEEERHGKADAINKILSSYQGDFLLFVNSDALPEKGSMAHLLNSINSNENIGVAAARPIFAGAKNSVSSIERLMWMVHNQSSTFLSQTLTGNHSNDEMMVVRSSAMHGLPFGLVNDGAFIALRAKIDGYLIKFCENAKVKIAVPDRILELINQRRRILFGHFQIWKLVGNAPSTVEFMLLSRPSLSVRIGVKSLAQNPSLIPALPLALATEFFSMILALFDVSRATTRHRVWQRYG